jgi:hypothetical protein
MGFTTIRLYQDNDADPDLVGSGPFFWSDAHLGPDAGKRLIKFNDKYIVIH